ncbi:hypothetical protein JCM5296_000066 [Sporobolomyces johnsonii]
MPDLPLARIDPALLSVSQQEQQRQQLADETPVPSTSRKRRRPQRASASATTSYKVADSDGSGSDAGGDDDEYQFSDASSAARRRSLARGGGGGRGTDGSGDDEGEEDPEDYMQPSLVKAKMRVKRAQGRKKDGGEGGRRGVSKQQRRLQEALARSGKSMPVGVGAEAEGKAKSCDNCRIRKMKCSRHEVCLACRMRGDICVWTEGAPTFPTESAATTGASFNRSEIDRLTKLVKVLTLRYTSREGLKAAREGRPPIPPPSIDDIPDDLPKETIDDLAVEATEERQTTSPLEDAEALLMFAQTPTNGAPQPLGTATSNDEPGLQLTDQPAPAEPQAQPQPTLPSQPATMQAAPTRPSPEVVWPFGRPPPQSLRVAIPSDSPAHRLFPSTNVNGVTAYNPSFSSSSTAAARRPSTVDPAFIPIGEHSSAQTPPSHLSNPFRLPGLPPSLPQLRPPPHLHAGGPPPMIYYPFQPSPLLSPRAAALQAQERYMSRLRQAHPATLELRRSWHENRWDRAKWVEQKNDKKKTAEKGKGTGKGKEVEVDELEQGRRELAKRAAEAWSAIATSGDGERPPPTGVEPYRPLSHRSRDHDPMLGPGGPLSAVLPNGETREDSDGEGREPGEQRRRSSWLVSPLASSFDLAGLSTGTSTTVPGGQRPNLTLVAPLDTSRHHLGLGSARTPNSAHASGTLGGGGISLSPMRSAHPLSAVEAGLCPLNSLLVDERFEPRLEGTGSAWDPFEPRIADRMELELDETHEDFGWETDGKSSVADGGGGRKSVGEKSTSGRSEKADESEEGSGREE